MLLCPLLLDLEDGDGGLDGYGICVGLEVDGLRGWDWLGWDLLRMCRVREDGRWFGLGLRRGRLARSSSGNSCRRCLGRGERWRGSFFGGC